MVAANPVDSHETHLFYEGNAFAGGTVDIRLIGPPGAFAVGLFAGSGVLEPALPSPWGDWYLKFPVFGPIILAPIPASGELIFPVTFPASPPGPYDLALQALIKDELTNLLVLAVE